MSSSEPALECWRCRRWLTNPHWNTVDAEDGQLTRTGTLWLNTLAWTSVLFPSSGTKSQFPKHFCTPPSGYMAPWELKFLSRCRAVPPVHSDTSPPAILFLTVSPPPQSNVVQLMGNMQYKLKHRALQAHHHPACRLHGGSTIPTIQDSSLCDNRLEQWNFYSALAASSDPSFPSR